MKWLLGILGALVLPGAAVAADDPAITACEIAVKSLIKTPATYQRASVVLAKNAATVAFDAQNGFGAVVRSNAICMFLPQGSNYEMSGAYIEGQRIGRDVIAALTGPARASAGVRDIAKSATGLTGP